jgi:ATP/maltotriose-dependent transcriptional regulator MalT
MRAMWDLSSGQKYPELKELIAEASRALTRMDCARLEELALSCQALNKDLTPWNTDQRKELERQAREVAPDMAVFARVLEATRSNLKVMHRLRELRMGQLEYSVGSAGSCWGAAGTKSEHGDD